MKKFYKVNEKVWVKEAKKTGIVKGLNKDNLTAKVLVGTELVELRFWEIDKFKKPEKILIKYFDETLPKLEAIKIGNWIDLRASEEIILNKFDFRLIPLGIAMQLPRGYEANIVPRSSTFKNFGIIQTNHFGVVDSTYCGDNDQWFFPALAFRDTVINKGDRICQFRINKVMPKLQFIEVTTLENEDRGGHGSSGVQ